MTWTGEGEPLRRRDWIVRTVPMDTARELVRRFHYTGGAAKQRAAVHGLFHRDSFWDNDARGAAWWQPPAAAVAKMLAPDAPDSVLGLSRLVVDDAMPGNAATFLLAASMRLLDRERWPILVTYADTGQGHTGAIYKATGWERHGETAPRPVYTLDGRHVATQAGDHTRRHDEMLALGCVLAGRHPKIRFVHKRR